MFLTNAWFNSGSLGDITTIYSEMGRVGFNQIAIAEKDECKTAFRDGQGQLWELYQSGFGVKVLPACFASLASTTLASLKSKDVRKWLGDILIYTETICRHA